MENQMISIIEFVLIIALIIFYENRIKFNKDKLNLLTNLANSDFCYLDIERLQEEKFNVIKQLGGNLKLCLKQQFNNWGLHNLGGYDLDIDQIKNEEKRQIIKFWFIDALGEIPAKKFAEMFIKNIEQNLRVDNRAYYKSIERGKELIFSAVTVKDLASSFYSELSTGIALLLKRPDLTEDEKIIIAAELINAKKIVKP